jgi:hypothetical protein
VLTSGAGTYGQGDYAVAASTTDGSSILAYLPTSRTVTLATASLGPDSVCAWWFRPADGTKTYAGAFASGSNVFTPPSSSDWVLVVDRKSLDLPPPGEQPAPTSVEWPAPARELKLVITPNPVHATSRIRFELPVGGVVRVTLLDAQGRERSRLAEGTYRAGLVELALDARALETGLYWCRVQAAGRDETRAVVIVR